MSLYGKHSSIDIQSTRDDNYIPHNNIYVEDTFLDGLLEKGEQVSIFLINGVCLTGRLVSHDTNCVFLRHRGNNQLIYKIAIATICLKNG